MIDFVVFPGSKHSNHLIFCFQTKESGFLLSFIDTALKSPLPFCRLYFLSSLSPIASVSLHHSRRCMIYKRVSCTASEYIADSPPRLEFSRAPTLSISLSFSSTLFLLFLSIRLAAHLPHLNCRRSRGIELACYASRGFPTGLAEQRPIDL